MSLDATVAGASANSYADLAYASSYFTTHVYGSTWFTYSSTLRETALITATRMLDDYIRWKGYKVDEDQALRWPRYGVYDLDGFDIVSSVVPPVVKQATCELATYLRAQKAAGSDPSASPDTKGYKRLKVGDLEIEVDKDDRDSGSVLPDPVIIMLEPFGIIRKRSGTRTSTLLRS
jgi:uncharacterized heparinase superfamily protein